MKILNRLLSGLSRSLSLVGSGMRAFAWNYEHNEWFAGIATLVMGIVLLGGFFLGIHRGWW